MKKKAKKWLSLWLGILGASVIACGAGIGIVSCSSTNSSTTTTPNPASSSSSTTNSSSSSKTTSSTSSSKTTSSSPKDTKSTSSSPTNIPQTNTTGLVTLNTFLTAPTTKEAVGQLISKNVYACGSKITLNANYTPPPNVTSGSDESDTITYAWYAGNDLIAGQVNSQCNIAGIFSTTTYKVVVTCQVYKETTTSAPATKSEGSQSSSKADSTTGTNSSSSSSSKTDKTDSSSSPSTTDNSPKTTNIVLTTTASNNGDGSVKTAGNNPNSDDSPSTNDNGSKTASSKPTTTKVLIKTYTCNTTLTVTVDYSNLSATLVYGANQMSTITSNVQTTLAVNLQYKFEGNGTTQPAGALYSFSTTDLKKLPSSTISFERYSFNQWNQINATNTSANSIQNLDYSYTPTGIYPLRAQLKIGDVLLTSNMLKVNTSYDGSVLDLNTIPTSLQSTYSYSSLMLLYIQQSLKEDGNNAPFMQLVNSWGQGYMFIEATSGNTYNQVNASDLTNFNVSWINAKDHADGLMVSATVNVANNKGLELLGYGNWQKKDYAYTTSNNLLIPNGDVISWTLPFGGMRALQWTITNGQVSNVNWNITNYPYNVFYNYGSSTNPSWHVYDWACTNQYGHPSISNSNIYWGYKVTTSSGQNALASLINSNTFYTKLNPTDSSYLLYNDFPLVSTNSSNMQIGYITLTSQCISLLNPLYQASIAGIAALENN